MKKTLYLVTLLVFLASCPLNFAQVPAWTGVIHQSQLRSGYVNLYNNSCGGWMPVHEGPSFTIEGTLTDGATVSVDGKAPGGSWHAGDGTRCVSQINAATEIRVVQTGLSASNYKSIVNGNPERYTAYGTAWPGTNFNWTSPGSPGGGGVGSLSWAGLSGQ
jgi:hypothetical protein